MKFFFLATTAAILSLTAKSQLQFGVFGGPQTTSASYTVQSVKQKTSFKGGFILGAGLKVPFENQLFFAPSIYYSMKGYKVAFNRFVYPPDSFAVDNNTTFHSVETAALLQFDFSTRPDHFFIKIGPSLDFQLFGKEKFNTDQGFVDRKIEFGYTKYGRYSANMHLQFGYEMSNGFFFQGNYSHGLANISNKDGGPRIRHRVFGITLGKFLGNSKIVVDTRNKE